MVATSSGKRGKGEVEEECDLEFKYLGVVDELRTDGANVVERRRLGGKLPVLSDFW